MRVVQLLLAGAVLFVSLFLTSPYRAAQALPPAGSDRLPVVATVDIASRLGDATVVLTGWAEIERQTPHDEGGVDVVDMEIVSMDLVGSSPIGVITVTQPTNIGPVAPAAEAAATGGDGDGFELTPGSAFRDRFSNIMFDAARDMNSGTSTAGSCADAGKDRHVYSEFNVNLPPTATVDGIQVRLDAWADDIAGDPFMCVELSWDGGATWTTPKTTPTLSISKGSRLLGGDTDTWGRTWSAGELSPDNFRLRITNVATDNQRDFSLDYVAVSVSYTATWPGEIRSLQSGQDFPASSFFDLSLAVTIPAAPGSTLELHNQIPLRLTPREGGQKVNLDAWPPLGVTYQMEPIFGVDNDGDGPADEDTPDEDGDGLFDEDQPGPDPVTPGSSISCGDDADCDGTDGEDPPLRYCLQNVLSACDNDNDGQADEDPSCVPLMNPSNRHEKSGFCVRDLTLEIAPELPSFSVAPGGPSGLHPADILALTPGDAPSVPPGQLSLVVCNDDFSGLGLRSQVSFQGVSGETYRIQIGSWDGTGGGDLTLNVFASAGSPSPAAVSGNDSFASAWTVPAVPFLGEQSTLSFTVETGEPNTLPGDACTLGAVGISKTAWYSFTPSTTETITINTADSTFDTVLAVYTGDTFGGGPSADQEAPFVRIPCASLGLTAGGCDSAGSVDDLNALSYGDDLAVGAQGETNFSVGPGAQGASGSAVEVQRNCPSPEPEPDVFSAQLNGSNTQELDGNGPIGTCAGAFPLGLVEGASVRDDLNALYGQDPIVVDSDLNGVPEQAVYFSLDLASPSLTSYGLSAADVLRTVNGGQPTVYASAAALGLEAGDDIDALCLSESGDGAYGAGDLLYFSLAPGSTTLGQIGAGPGDILRPGSPNPGFVQGAASLGLVAGDDLDAAKCLAFKDPDGDTDGDTIVNSIDLDDDNDGCSDVEEARSIPSLGGLRNPHSYWDFFDTPAGMPPERDQVVNIIDIAAVVLRFGTVSESPLTKEEAFAQAFVPPEDLTSYHAAFDRDSPIPGENLWNLLPANGAINIIDIGATVVQFGHTCVAPG